MQTEALLRRERQLAGSPWRRFLQSVPGQVLANPPAFRLHEEMLMHRDHRVLEVGCGFGSRLMLLDNALRFARHTAVGVEPSPRLARHARRAFVSNRRPITAVLADPAHLPFADASFDMAYCADLLRFLDVRAAQAALREVARVIKPGSMIVAWELAPAEGTFARWQRFWLRRYDGRITSEKSLMSLAERSGFAFAREAFLRPWFWPPIPRASFLAATLAPGWRIEGNNLIPPQPSQAESPSPPESR